MKSVFILEDRDERMPLFKKWLDMKTGGEYRLSRAIDVATAMDILLRDEYDILFLDHDLDQKAFVASDSENTGYQLAKWIAKKNIKFEQCIIHSLNPAGAKRMNDELPRAIAIPFNILMES